MEGSARNKTLLPQIVLSALFTLGYFGTLGVMLTGYMAVPEAHEALVTSVVGSLTVGQALILGYWFGSGPKEQDK